MDNLQRLKTLQAELPKLLCDALIIEDPLNLLYMTGMQLSAGKLLVHREGASLLVDSRYYETCRKNSPFPVQLSDRLPLADWLFSAGLKETAAVGIDSARTTYKGFLEWQAVISSLASGSKGSRHWKLQPVDSPLKLLRSIKSPQEVKLLQNAARLGSEGYDFVLSLLKPGIREIEAANELEIFWKKRGALSAAFEPIIAFGANGSMPHHRAGQAKLKKGDAVLIDIGVNLNHYHSDMTRVVFFGQPEPKLKEIYAIVKEAQEKALMLCRPGIAIGELDTAAREHIAAKGFGDYFKHSLGHGIGLETHEFPIIRQGRADSSELLKPGMAITIEPGIYLPDIGGVRIEDTVVITKTSYENLTDRPKDLLIISPDYGTRAQ